MSIRVLLVGDEALVRAGFRVLVESEPGLEVVGEAATCDEAVGLIRGARADVALVNVRAPGPIGLAAVRAVSLTGIRVLVMTSFESDGDYVVAALRAGAGGLLGRCVEVPALLRSVRMVADGKAVLSPEATQVLIDRCLALPDMADVTAPELESLTERERQVLVLVASGLSNGDIAGHLCVSPSTAKTHVNRVMAKLGARDRARLVVIAYQTGVARLAGPVRTTKEPTPYRS